MAREIDPAVQALLEATLAGTEIIVVLEIFWTDRSDLSIQTFPAPASATPRTWYADRDIAGAPEVVSNILTFSSVDAAVQVSQGGQSKSVKATLDDTDGTVKAIYNENDIHKTPVRVWFWVEGTDFATKKFPIFLGQINTPIVWNEGKRTFDFQIVNRIEDAEVGLSLEEGEFDALPEELIGKTLPLCFGTTINVPALKVVPTISGVLQNGVGIKDFTLGGRIALADLITCPQTPIGYKCHGAYPLVTCVIAYEQDQNCLQARCLELEYLQLSLTEQSAFEFGTITIFNGERFPQGIELTLNINGGLFTGEFKGTNTDPINVFSIQSRQHPDYDPATGSVFKDPVQNALDSACPGSNFQAADSNFTDTIHGPQWTGMRDSRISWENFRNAAKANFFWAQGGSTVTVEDLREIIYVANIVPSTIHSVKALRTLNGNDFLLTVPDDFYEVRQTDYNGYDVMEIVFQRPLSSEDIDTGGGWNDTIYITQTSSVGPNTVAILEWIIETYTDYAIDSTSFDDVRAKIEVYPMDFPLLTRPGLLAILQKISRQARCALWQRDDTFFIKYLPEVPTPVAILNESDILRDNPEAGGRGTLKIELTDTENLITKQTAEWKKDYGPFTQEKNRLILRHNAARQKYGTHDATTFYFTFAHLDLVKKSATFWMIRESNSWKRLVLQVPLKYTLLEPFDAVTVNLPDVATGSFLGIVERAVLDSAGKHIDLELWTPIRSGEMTPYDFAFPAGISEHALFPTLEARDAGLAGSGTDPNFSVITPPGHPLTPDRTGVFSGFSLSCNGDPVSRLTGAITPGECRQDHGDRHPSDIDDTKPTVSVPTDSTGGVSGSSSPVTNGSGTRSGSRNWQLTLQQDKIEGDAGRAREIAEGGGTGDSAGSGDNADPVESTLTQEDLNALPDPDDIEAFHCTVTVTAFKTKSSFTGVPTTERCIPDGPTFEETYAFDSAQGASDFCGQFTGRPSCGGLPSCDTCINACAIACSGTGSEGDGNLIGYNSGTNTGFGVILGG